MKKRIIKVIVLIILLSLSLLLSIKLLEIIKFKCIFKELFNIKCAGCGATRMLKELFKLNIYKAFMYNPVMFLYLLLFVIYFIYNALLYIKKGKIKLLRFSTIIILVVILFIFMILRNIL